MSNDSKSGRPTLFKEEYCQKLIDHMAEGLSYESFAGLLGVGRSTLYDWEKSHPQFSDSKKIGKDKMALFFERLGIDAMTGKIEGFNASTYIFTIKNKLGWRDKQEIENNTRIEINIDGDDSKL